MPEIDLGLVRGPKGDTGAIGPQGPQGPQGNPSTVNGKNADSNGAITLIPPDIGAASNPNLLLNSDFRHPVNRNGQAEYTVQNYTIDKWRSYYSNISLQEESLLLKCSSETNEGSIAQFFDGDDLFGSELTFSVLLLGNVLVTGTGILQGGTNWANTAMIQTDNVKLWLQNNNYRFCSLIETVNHKSINIVAAKLEHGTQQTLAHRDASGNWVLNDPPNYDLQYALCSLYSPTTGEWVGWRHSNPNLLDNWYFADPINQRGQTEYTARGYTIDRWKMIIDIGTILIDDGIILDATANAITWTQPVEPNLTKALAGKTVTMSVLYEAITDLTAGTAIMTQSSGASPAIKNRLPLNTSAGQSVCRSITFTYDADITHSCWCYVLKGQKIKLKAVKLELGSQQTLAHQDAPGNWVLNDPLPNKALEMAKCQRYFQRIEVYVGMDYISSGAGIFNLDFLQPMRITPVVLMKDGSGNELTLDPGVGPYVWGITNRSLTFAVPASMLSSSYINSGTFRGTFELNAEL